MPFPDGKNCLDCNSLLLDEDEADGADEDEDDEDDARDDAEEDEVANEDEELEFSLLLPAVDTGMAGTLL